MPYIDTCFRFYTQMHVEKKKHLHTEFIVTSHNSVIIDNFCTTALTFTLTLAVWLRLLTHGSLKSYESKYINLYWTKSHQHPRLCNALSLQNTLKVWSSTPSLFLPREQCNNLYCIIKKTNNLCFKSSFIAFKWNQMTF